MMPRGPVPPTLSTRPRRTRHSVPSREPPPLLTIALRAAPASQPPASQPVIHQSMEHRRATPRRIHLLLSSSVRSCGQRDEGRGGGRRWFVETQSAPATSGSECLAPTSARCPAHPSSKPHLEGRDEVEPTTGLDPVRGCLVDAALFAILGLQCVRVQGRSSDTCASSPRWSAAAGEVTGHAGRRARTHLYAGDVEHRQRVVQLLWLRVDEPVLLARPRAAVQEQAVDVHALLVDGAEEERRSHAAGAPPPAGQACKKKQYARTVPPKIRRKHRPRRGTCREDQRPQLPSPPGGPGVCCSSPPRASP